MDARVIGMLASRSATAGGSAPARLGRWRTAVLVGLISAAGLLLAVAPVLSWTVWFHGQW